MDEATALKLMVAPGQRRPGKYLGGIIQIIVTSVCDLSCYACTQGSNLRRKPWFMTTEQFEQAVLSLRGWTGVYGVFGGNPCTSPHFGDYCEILREHVPFRQRGLWSNNLLGHGKECRATFDPSHSNINVHLSREAAAEVKRDWPEAVVVGLTDDSRHSPPFVAMKDVLRKPCPECDGHGIFQRPDMETLLVKDRTCPTCGGSGEVYDEAKAWELISRCDINQHWSAMIGVFRGELRAWFCEVAGAQAMLHQDEPDYPDTGLPLVWSEKDKQDYLDLHMRVYGKPPRVNPPVSETKWWELPMGCFAEQVRKHCHECGVPLRGRGELSQASEASRAKEQTSATHAAVYRPKRKYRELEMVTDRAQLGEPLGKMTDYIGNSKR